VRENLSSYDEDPGWYEPPPGTLASLAPAEMLRQSGIDADASTAPRAPAAVMRSWEQAKPDNRGSPTERSQEHGSQPGLHSH
jgi:hypothetical protein